MKQGSVRLGSTVVVVALAGAASHYAGCVLEELDPVDTGDGGGGGAGAGEVGGAGGSVATGGSGGFVEASRGDPADFPTECIESCEEACAELETCDAASSTGFPIDNNQCLARCATAQGGPFWEDVSQNFLCCASQGSCDAVQHCGGWLDHPAADNSCDKVCECYGGNAASRLFEGKQAPRYYRFAPDVLYVAVTDASVDLRSVPGVTAARRGRIARVKLAGGSGADTLAALRRVGKLLPTFVDGAGRFSAANGRIVVVPSGAADVAAAAQIASARSMPAPRALGFGKGLLLIDGTDGWAALDALAELTAAGVHAELDMLREHQRRYIPDDPLFEDQWHLLSVGQGESTAGADGRVSEAWDVTRGDPQIIMAINDDGVNLDHPDFAGKLEPEMNYPGDWQIQVESGSFAGHGSAVAGVAGALADDSVGGAGVCPACRILPHYFRGLSEPISDTEVGENFKDMVDAGAAVINNSWGLSLGNAVFVEAPVQLPPLPSAIEAAFDYAEQNGRGGKGTVLVWACGNENTQLDYYNTHPLTVAVSAVGDLGSKSYYSSLGPEVTVGAPSSGQLTGITTTRARGGHTDAFGGTSSASPFITGVVGLILSANPDLTAAEVRAVLADSSTKIDPVFGDWGSGHSVYYGYGLVNAYVAVQMANGSCADAALCPAPSDDCGNSCGTKTLCDSCRTHADCAVDHVCQPMASLGRMVCVPSTSAGPCPVGTTAVNGYCLPSMETCGLCAGGGEECNGRDDNCDGVVDEGACETTPGLCFADGPGCVESHACAGISCVPRCTQDDECEGGYQCELLKNQYGSSSSVRGCVFNPSGECGDICGVLAASVDDEALAAFVECMEDGEVSCNNMQQCLGDLVP